MGGHPSAAGSVTTVQSCLQMASGAYRIPAVGGEIRLLLTNRMPVSAYRGAVQPDMAYLVERLVDDAARQTGLDRIKIRRRNMIPAAAFPYPIRTMPGGLSYDSADWDGFEARRTATAAKGRLRAVNRASGRDRATRSAPAELRCGRGSR